MLPGSSLKLPSDHPALPFQVAAKRAPLLLRQLQKRLGESLEQCGDVRGALHAFLAAGAAYGSNSDAGAHHERLQRSNEQSTHKQPSPYFSTSFPAIEGSDATCSGYSTADHEVQRDLLLEDSHILHLGESHGLLEIIVENARSPKLFRQVSALLAASPSCGSLPRSLPVRCMRISTLCSWHAAHLEQKARKLHIEEKERNCLLGEATKLYQRAKNWKQAVKLLLQLGRQEEALKVCRDSGDSSAGMSVATVLAQQGQLEEAIKLLIECDCIARATQ